MALSMQNKLYEFLLFTLENIAINNKLIHIIEEFPAGLLLLNLVNYVTRYR